MEYRVTRINQDELYHFGVKGMKWGHRRYQNKDGTLTDTGRKRYARDSREKEFYKYDEEKEVYYKNSGKKGNKRTENLVDVDRYVKEDMERSKTLVNETQNLSRNVKNAVDRSIRNNPKTQMDLSNMTDKEMREQINRAMLERQYNDMFAPRKSTAGREYVAKTLETAGDVLAITASALGIALAIKQLRGPAS